MKFGVVPSESGERGVDRDLSKLAPKFHATVDQIIGQMKTLGHDAIVFEGYRSDERAAFLYGFGRDYDDGRGVVTNAPVAAKTWHRYGLAVDIISARDEWDAPDQFWTDLRSLARSLGLVSGADWTTPDRPHCQWNIPGMHVTPSDHAWALLQTAGVEAVWSELHAI